MIGEKVVAKFFLYKKLQQVLKEIKATAKNETGQVLSDLTRLLKRHR